MKKFFVLIAVFLGSVSLFAAINVKNEPPEKYWDIDLLKIKPEYRKSPYKDSDYPGLHAILIKGFGPAKGDKTLAIYHPEPNPLSKKVSAEFFAYMGFPEGPVPKGGFPAVVLIPGGGGTAFPQYAKYWMSKGFAVITLDYYNRRPIPPAICNEMNVPAIPFDGGSRQDHVANVANMVLAHSVLRSQPNVNPSKTAFVGLSWGSWYGLMLAAVDNRFKGGVAIYCGDINRRGAFINGRFHHAVKVPIYWVVSTNDQNMTVETISAAFNGCPKTYNHSIVVNLLHSHTGFYFDSCIRMVSHFLNGAPNLPKLSRIKVKNGIAGAEILDRGKGIKEAFLCYTDSNKQYHLRRWNFIPAEIKGNTISAKIPEKAHSYYLTAYEDDSIFDDLCGSTDAIVLEPK